MDIAKVYSLIIPYLDYKTCFDFRLVSKETFKVYLKLDQFSTKHHPSSTDSNADNATICSILKSSRNLQIVDIEFKSVNNSQLEPIKLMQELNQLTINGCHNITNEFFKGFDSEIKLSKFELYWMPQITDLTPIFSLKSLKSSLTYLNLSGCKHLSLESLQLVTHLTELRHLDLTRCVSVDDQLIENISINLTKLKYLNLYALPMLNCRFMENLSQDIEFIDLCGNQYVTDSDILKLKANKLKSLNLTWCNKLTDLSIEYISKTNNDLNLLSVHGNTNITDLSLKYLMENPLIKFNLETLDVFGCSSIEHKSENFLKENFPNLKTIKYHS